MPSIINTNIASLNAQRNLNSSQSALQTSLQRLSSGLRINSAKDDAAGLAISSRMDSQIRGLNQAARNANDGISFAQTAEGAMGEITNNLQRMRELSVQASNDTNSASDRASIQKEVSQLQQEIGRISSQTSFNGKNLLDGSFTSQKFQVGAYADQNISFSIGSTKATDIGSQSLSSTGTISAATAGVVSATPVANNVAAQNLTVSGNLGSQSGIAVAAGATAKDIASKINSYTSSTGVSASASTTATLSAVGTGTVSFNLNGSNSTSELVSANVTSTSDLSTLAAAINGKSANTGITAQLSADKASITLNSADGSNVAISNFSNSTAASTMSVAGGSGAAVALGGGAVGAPTATTVGGTLSFSSTGPYSVNTDTAGTLFTVAANASSLSAVSTVNVGTQTGANSALKVLDGALAQINDQRATLGAVQNRFNSAIANMQATSENLSAAKSRITDTDFAAETASMTRNQILQQAGTAMLAQANSLPNGVLSLLRG